MARPPVDPKKYDAVRRLNPGDIVKLGDNTEAEFVKCNIKKFVGILDGTRYNIPINFYESTKSTVDVQKVREQKSNRANQLQLNDLFYIKKDEVANVYRFIEMEKGQILASNPLTQRKIRIPPSMFEGFLNDL